MVDYQTLVSASAGARRSELAALDRVAPLLPRRRTRRHRERAAARG
jgi:hypothetical protein